MILFTIVLLMVVSHAKNIHDGGDGGFEITPSNASMFLQKAESYVGNEMSKREIGRNCVPCKFGINPCCAPNICRKKTFWPDECMEIKRAKGNGVF